VTIEATGERFIPEVMGGQLIEAEHVARYALAAQLVRGRRVLDGGCGVGWGTGLLMAAGAASAAGLDLDADAVANAARRVPSATFVQGDLAALPWDAEQFDVVVCFETIEHVSDQARAFDELVRVLAPEGVLLVSSPNPRVYPAGNPFHIRELTPEELVSAVRSRLPHVSLWNQHSQIASVLVQRDALRPGATREALARSVAQLESGSDPYSVIVAGRQSSPLLPPLVCLAPSDQLVHLEELGRQLSDERERLADDRLRIVTEGEQGDAERQQFLAERQQLLDEGSTMALQVEEQNASLLALAERVASLKRQIEALRHEREHTAVLLLESEQQLADTLATSRRTAADREQLFATLTETVGRLYHELNVLRMSRSWRLTAPLRATRRLLARTP
jgi:O-antigen biosynthesis protein